MPEKLFRISYLEHKTNDWVRSKTNFLVCPQEPLLSTGYRDGNLHDLSMSHATAVSSKTILQGTLKNNRRRGRQIKCWMDNIEEWTFLPMPDLLTRSSCRQDWKKISAESCLRYPRRPNRSREADFSCHSSIR